MIGRWQLAMGFVIGGVLLLTAMCVDHAELSAVLGFAAGVNVWDSLLIHVGIRRAG